MQQSIFQIALLVADYDEAIRFYIDKLNFVLVEDTKLSETKRWVVIAPQGNQGCSLLLARAANAEQRSRVGNQTGGRVFLFLYTDNFWQDHKRFTDQGVFFVREPSEEPYGTVAVFKDLYGNLWDLIQKNKTTDSHIINKQ
jgi:catechol 2,3-dioxygenase-like lactoylglutathione lyase family enzyme